MGGLDQYMAEQDEHGKEKTKEKPSPKPEAAPAQPPKDKPSPQKLTREAKPSSPAAKEDADEEPEESEEDEVVEREPEPEDVIEVSSFEAETPQDTGPCVILSVSYSGRRRKALVKLYDIDRKKIVFWYDNTGHQPYLLTNVPLRDVLTDPEISSHPGFDAKASKEIRKYDLLNDRERVMTVIAGKDPTTVGGRPDSIREYLKDSWEDHIRYRDCYILDRQLIPGSIYRIANGSLVREGVNVPTDAIRERFPKASPEFLKSLYDWFPLLVSPVPDYKRVAIDIEVETEAQDRIPDPEIARNAVICASLAGSDGLKKALILRRPGRVDGARPEELPADVQLVYHDSELALLKELFRHFLDYPIVMTFNGDNFDLHYLWRRAQVLGMRRDEVPITMGREIALMPTAIHFDLYKFFHNHAIQIYAFSHAYKETSLNAISESLLKLKKIELDRPINDLDYLALASYCFRDSLITLKLTQENSNVAMHLTTLIMRISRLSMEDATRQGVSSWIRNLFYFEHRAKNCLIPRQDDIEAMKGGSSTTAIIKGKKYQGAVVIKPESGAFFNVVVLDFASLYPSIISRWNLSYETVECVHPECRTNKVPGTDHWVCTKRTGMMSLIIGMLKDVRVKWFKPMSKDQTLPEDERSFYKVVQQALKVFLNACFTGDTAILTVDGPRNIKDVLIGDRVINVNPETLEPEVDEITETQVFDYSGDLLHFENDSTADLTVTPDHRMLVAGENGKATFTTAEKLFSSHRMTIPKINAASAAMSADAPALKAFSFTSKGLNDINKNPYLITWRDAQRVDNWQKTKVLHNGKVYCVTTRKNHTVFAGRNGRLMPCGQCYGVFGAEIFPLYCLALADSTTAIGRSIITDTINRATDMGVKVLYGDSVAGDSVIDVVDGGQQSEVRIADLFKSVDVASGSKEYCYPESLRATALDFNGNVIWSPVNAVMRHKCRKRMFRVWLDGSWHIDVTEDHSLIGYRGGPCNDNSGIESHLVNVRATDVGKEIKQLVVLNKQCSTLQRNGRSVADYATISPIRIEEIPYDGYVYDLEIEGTHRFFANNVLVHNTDSIFLHQPTKDQIKELLGWAESNLGIDLEVDKRYNFVAFSGRKKNYLGVMDNGNVDIKGLMGKKRNTPPFIKDAFVEMIQVIRDVKTPQDFENAKIMIKEIVQGCYSNLKAKKVPLNGLIFKVMLARSVDHYTKTTPQHVKAAVQLVNKGKEVKPGDLISFVKVTGKEGVRPVQLARIDEIDVEKYVGHIQSTFGQVLDALDIEFDEIVGVKRLEFFSK